MELQVFNNAEFGSVRTAIIDGEPYLVGKDVAEILGYTNPSRWHINKKSICARFIKIDYDVDEYTITR